VHLVLIQLMLVLPLQETVKGLQGLLLPVQSVLGVVRLSQLHDLIDYLRLLRQDVIEIII
jgi:hypothetical protein